MLFTTNEKIEPGETLTLGCFFILPKNNVYFLVVKQLAD
jgi:hypothetical protein